MNTLEHALLAEGLSVSTIPGKGRSLVAAKDFFPGDVIICQKPYASSPGKSSTGPSCDGCFASANLRKCSGCRIARYCGSGCQVVLTSVEVDLREITQNFSKLSCNAHTICDEELRPLGTGLYTLISIINHSCMPNSVLMFDGQIAFVRAVEHIYKGDEVVISYIDIAATTEGRQNSLKQYFFKCNCPRCTKSPNDDLKENAILEGYRCKDQRCYGILLYQPVKKAFTCQVCNLIRDEHEISTIANMLEEASAKVASFISSGNSSEAMLLYKNVEQCEIKLLHPYSIKLMRTRETLLKIAMELNDWADTLAYCRLTIPVYQRLYQSPHPMLGLQHYTCGKLEWLLEQTEDALKSFTEAVKILRITHGTSSPFIKELLSKLEEARAEYQYKFSDTEG